MIHPLHQLVNQRFSRTDLTIRSIAHSDLLDELICLRAKDFIVELYYITHLSCRLIKFDLSVDLRADILATVHHLVTVDDIWERNVMGFTVAVAAGRILGEL